MDPLSIEEATVRRLATVDFPWDIPRANELGLFKTIGIPSMARAFSATGKFDRTTAIRFLQTDLILATLQEHGHSSPEGRDAIRHMNRAHKGLGEKYPDEFLYTYALIVLEPIRWTDQFGWRRWTEEERNAWFDFWTRVLEMMNVKGAPGTLADLTSWADAFEDRAMQRSDESVRIANTVIVYYLGRWVPKALVAISGRVLNALLDERLLRATGRHPASRALQWVARAVLHVRARFLAVRHALGAPGPTTRVEAIRVELAGVTSQA